LGANSGEGNRGEEAGLGVFWGCFDESENQISEYLPKFLLLFAFWGARRLLAGGAEGLRI
jgi:hypothetical protein